MLRMGTWTERRFHSVPFSREKEAQSFEREQLITKPLSRGFSPSRPLSLSLLLRREESSRKRWKQGLQRNRRYFKLFYTQSGACLTQWLVKKGTLTLQVDVQLTTSLQRLPLCNC